VRTRITGALVALALLLSPLAGLPATAAASKWTRLRTPTFTLIGDQGERPLRKVAERLEQFREVFGRVFPNTRQSLPAPIVVHVFGSQRAYQPFMPLFNGKRVDVAGYFQPGSANDFITLNTERGEDGYPVIFHEYVHLLVGLALADVPVWFNEGLAEYYSTYEMFGEREATLGRFKEDHVLALRERFIPLKELLAVDHRSPMYNEGDRRGIFYAESWALVHYLLIGSPQRKGQLATFLEKYGDGRPTADAVREAFGVAEADLEKELRTYVQKSVYQAYRVRFNDKVTIDKDWTIDQPSDADAQAALADLLLAIRRPEDAAARAQAALEQVPNHARAQAVLARVRASQGKGPEALALMDRAVVAAADTDYLPAFYQAALLLRGEGDVPATTTQEAADKAVTLLQRVTRLKPTFAEGHGLLAYALLVADDAKAAMPEALTAFKLSPRHEYALFHARARVRLLDQGAREPLQALAARASADWIRQDAVRLLDYLDQAKKGPPRQPPPPGVGAPAETALTVGPPRLIPVFRETQAGEVREFGTFERVECTRDGLIFSLKTPGGMRRLSTKAFDQVEFLTYRPEPPGQVGCGVRPKPERVYFTYRAGNGLAGAEGVVVAIELLADDFEP
jgi:tetratricopeptide (TPR) repeat protein